MGLFEGRNAQLFEEAEGGAAGPVISQSARCRDSFFLPHSVSVYGLSHTACYSFTQLITKKQSCVNSASHGGSFRGEGTFMWSQQLRGSGRLLGESGFFGIMFIKLFG